MKTENMDRINRIMALRDKLEQTPLTILTQYDGKRAWKQAITFGDLSAIMRILNSGATEEDIEKIENLFNAK
jgi:hypothetical protein